MMTFQAISDSGWTLIDATPGDRMIEATDADVFLRRQSDDPDTGARGLLKPGRPVILPGRLTWALRLVAPRPGAGVRIWPALPLKTSRAGPGLDMYPITPDDGADIAVQPDALYVTSGGNVAVVSAAGEDRVWPVTDFTILPVGVRRVKVTGTTASGIFGIV